MRTERRNVIKRFFLAIMLACMVTCGAVSETIEYVESFPDYVRVGKGITAYFEPYEDQSFVIGTFYYSSYVQVMDMIDDWYNVVYYYDPQTELDLFPQESIDDCGFEGLNSVYVKISDVIEIPPQSVSDLEVEKNLIMTERLLALQPDTSAASVYHFDAALLTEFASNIHAPSDVFEIGYTTRNKYIGQNADYADALVVQTRLPYHDDNSAVYLPKLTAPDSSAVFYALDGNASGLTVPGIDATYYPSDRIDDVKVLNGIRFILTNSPPYKTYDCYPADFENASRTAAALALRGFMRDYAASDDWLDIFNGIEAYNTNDLPNDYLGYMQYLYAGAVEAFNADISNADYYLSYEQISDFEVSNGTYVSSARITTDSPNGWLIRKADLTETGVSLFGVESDDVYYIGPSGSSVVTIIGDIRSAGKDVSFSFLYPREGTTRIVAVYEAHDRSLPLVATLCNTDDTSFARSASVRFPAPSLIDMTFETEDHIGVPNVFVEFSGTNFNASAVTDLNGNISLGVIPGVYTYTIASFPENINIPDALTQTLTITSGANTTAHVVCESVLGTVLIQAVSSLDSSPVQGAAVALLNDAEAVIANGTTDENGFFRVDDLELGTYTIKQTNRVSGFLQPEMVYLANVLSSSPVTVQVPNTPYTGVLQVSVKDKTTGGPVADLELDVMLVGTDKHVSLTTDENGTAVCELVSGSYSLKNLSVPYGYSYLNKTNQIEKRFSIQSDKTISLEYKLEPIVTSLTVYLREPPEMVSFNPSKPSQPIERGDCNLSGCSFELILAENALDSNGNTIASAGTVVASGVSAGKNAEINMSGIIPGKYILRETQSSAGYLPAEDIEIDLCDIFDDTRKAIGVEKTPYKADIHITKMLNAEEPEAGAAFMLYPARYKSFNSSRPYNRFDLVTDENGNISVEGVPYGKYVLVQKNSRATTSLKDRYEIMVDSDHPTIQYIRFVGAVAESFVPVTVIDALNESPIPKPSTWRLKNAEGELVTVFPDSEDPYSFSITGNGWIPVTLPEGTYTLVQTVAPVGYAVCDDIGFAINNETEAIEAVRAVNSRSVFELHFGSTIPTLTGFVYDNNSFGLVEAIPVYTDIPYNAKLYVSAMDKQVVEGYADETIIQDASAAEYSVVAIDLPAHVYQDYSDYLYDLKDETGESVHISVALKHKAVTINGSGLGIVSALTDDVILGIYAVDLKEHAVPRNPLYCVSTSDSFSTSLVLPEGLYCVADIASPLTDRVYFSVDYSVGSEVNIDLRYLEGYPVTFVVTTDDSEQPLANVYVDIDGSRYYTDRNGELTLPLNPGTHEASVVLAPNGYGLSSGKNVIRVFDDGSNDGNAVIRLKPQTLSVLIRDENGEGIDGVTMQMRDLNTNAYVTAVSDVNGIASFRNVRFGSYEITERYSAPGYGASAIRIQVAIDGTSLVYDSPVAVIQKQLTGISCIVTDSNNQALKDAVLQLTDNQGNTIQEASTDAYGNTAFYGIPYGSYTVSVKHAPNGYLRSLHGATFTVSSTFKQDKPFTFVCQDASLEYRITAPDGNGIPQAAFDLIEKDTATVVQSAISDRSGHFTFVLPDYGEYLITESYIPAGTTRVADMDVSVNDAWHSPGVTHLVSVSDRYEFLVIDNRGHILPGVTFSMESSDNSFSAMTASSNAEGWVTFNGLGFGTYYIKPTDVPEGFNGSSFVLKVEINDKYVPPEKPYVFMIQ